MKIETSSVVLDREQLRSITMDDQELMREVVADLLTDTSAQIEKLRQAVERADAGECVRVAHSARGACGNVGAVSLAALFCAVEQQAARGDVRRCQSRIGDLAAEMEKLKSEVESI